jgi:hypothetical protein
MKKSLIPIICMLSLITIFSYAKIRANNSKLGEHINRGYIEQDSMKRIVYSLDSVKHGSIDTPKGAKPIIHRIPIYYIDTTKKK